MMSDPALPQKWVALLGRPDAPTDGVADYCAYLATGLEARGIEMG